MNILVNVLLKFGESSFLRYDSRYRSLSINRKRRLLAGDRRLHTGVESAKIDTEKASKYEIMSKMSSLF